MDFFPYSFLLSGTNKTIRIFILCVYKNKYNSRDNPHFGSWKWLVPTTGKQNNDNDSRWACGWLITKLAAASMLPAEIGFAGLFLQIPRTAI